MVAVTKTNMPFASKETSPKPSIEDLNTYTLEKFRNNFLPHHAPTGCLYLNKRNRQISDRDSPQPEATNDYIHVFDPAPESSSEDEPLKDTAPAFKQPAEYVLHLTTSSTISSPDLNACLNLVARTSSADYKASSIGWSPARKRAEMQLDDMKYLLWSRKSGHGYNLTTYKVEGFLSFMLTYEDGIPVIYCYEIHLKPKLQGRGIGRDLMEMMEGVGRKAGVKKAMLTVFTRNKATRGWYERMGYRVDEFSPSPKRLRGGRTKEPEYVILSKPLVGKESEVSSEEVRFSKEWEEDEESNGEVGEFDSPITRAPDTLAQGHQGHNPPTLTNDNG